MRISDWSSDVCSSDLDGTPLPGQYGAVTALPLMFEVIDSLPRRRSDNVQRPPPSNVIETEICWPLGTAAEGLPPALCQRRMKAWTLDGVVPTTFAEDRKSVVEGKSVSVGVDPGGRRCIKKKKK